MLTARLGEARQALFLGAHCDDIEIGCGATLLAWPELFRGMRIDWVVFSSNPAREAEARAAVSAFLPDHPDLHVQVLNFRNGFFPSEWSRIKEAFEGLKALADPDLVFTHSCQDLHQDHRTLGELTWNTFRTELVLEYEVPKYDGDLGNPNTFVEVPAEAVERKAQLLLDTYATQGSKHWFTRDLLVALPRLRGMQCAAASGHAEAFHTRKLVVGP